MKRIIPYLFFMLPLLSLGQQADSITDDTTVYQLVDEMPEFPGGRDSMYRFILSHIKMPVEFCGAYTAIVGFIVEKDGSLSNITVKRNIGQKEFDAEAVRLVGIMPAWIPGKKDGQVVRTSYLIPVRFKIR